MAKLYDLSKRSRLLRARGVEIYVIHAAADAVPREMRRAKN
jgi:hypothetical protein